MAIMDEVKKAVQNLVQIAVANCHTKSHEVKSERGENLYFAVKSQKKRKPAILCETQA